MSSYLYAHQPRVHYGIDSPARPAAESSKYAPVPPKLSAVRSFAAAPSTPRRAGIAADSVCTVAAAPEQYQAPPAGVTQPPLHHSLSARYRTTTASAAASTPRFAVSSATRQPEAAGHVGRLAAGGGPPPDLASYHRTTVPPSPTPLYRTATPSRPTRTSYDEGADAPTTPVRPQRRPESAGVGHRSLTVAASTTTTPRGDTAATVRYHHAQSSAATLSARSTTAVESARQAAPDASASFMTRVARDEDTRTPQKQVLRRSSVSHANTAPPRRGPSLLPPSGLDRRMMLVLDMDETLLHAEVTPTKHDASFIVEMGKGQSTPVYVKFRPHLQRFMTVVSRLFEVVVFTASIPGYANQVLDHIDPTGELVHHRLFRQHCTEVNGTYVKDLDRLGRPVNRVAIVDNSAVAYSFHPENAVPIPSWYECDRDGALSDLLPHLVRLSRADCALRGLSDIRRTLQWD